MAALINARALIAQWVLATAAIYMTHAMRIFAAYIKHNLCLLVTQLTKGAIIIMIIQTGIVARATESQHSDSLYDGLTEASRWRLDRF